LRSTESGVNIDANGQAAAPFAARYGERGEMRRRTHVALALPVLVVVMLVAGGTASGDTQPLVVLRDATTGKLLPQSIPVQVKGQTVNRRLPWISPGALASADQRMEGADATPDVDLVGQTPNSAIGCGARNTNGNVRVNQDCSFRRQAETDMSFNPADPTNLLAGQNDSRVGFNQCGIDWSTDSGAHWGDLLPPFRQHLNSPEADGFHTIQGQVGTEHTYDAASDPTTAFDASGRGYFSCVMFDVASNATGVFVMQSPAVAKGSSFFNIPTSGPAWTVVEDNSGTGFTTSVLHDKEFITTDTSSASGGARVAGAQNNVYVTWTVFFFDNRCGGGHPGGGYCQSPIFGAMSTNGGRTWSAPEEISGSSASLCFFGNFFDPRLDEHKCDFNQGSDPIVLPDGRLVVPFNNGNTPAGNPNGQQLAVVCSPSGTTDTQANAQAARLNCGAPQKVGDDFIFSQNASNPGSEPLCNFGRGPEECIPGAFIRTNDFPRSAINTSNGDVYVGWQDYRNGEFDIQLAKATVSASGTLSVTQLGTVNPDTGKDHYFAAIDVDEGSGKVGASYYRTDRVAGENTTPSGGFSPCPGSAAGPTPGVSTCQPGVGDSLSIYGLAAGTSTPFTFVVLSPSFVAPDGAQRGFNGDYNGLTITPNGTAHPSWSDTRNTAISGNGVVHDEDHFTCAVALP
jgi:hypothetical protein